MEGVVAYSNKAKVEILGVSEDLIGKHGAVSPQVARAMAEGIKKGLQQILLLESQVSPVLPAQQKKNLLGLVYISRRC